MNIIFGKNFAAHFARQRALPSTVPQVRPCMKLDEVAIGSPDKLHVSEDNIEEIVNM